MAAPALWYFDIISPFAHIALARLDTVLAGRPVRLRPVVLGALLKHWGQLGPAEIAPKRLHTYRLALHTARQQGVTLRFPPGHPFNPLPMQRLLTALEGEADAVRTAFRLVWGEGRDAGDPAVLAAVAAAAGQPEALEAIAYQSVKDQLRQTTEDAIAAGVFGVPSLVVDGEVFWGADAMALAGDYLADPSLFAQGEMARLAALPASVQRRL